MCIVEVCTKKLWEKGTKMEAEGQREIKKQRKKVKVLRCNGLKKEGH